MEDKKTCLFEEHVKLGAQMVSFGGFTMPLQYSGIATEHNAVRHDCGVFDVSHMGEVSVKGEDAERFVQHIFTNDVSQMPSGKILYGMMLYETGGVVDDLLVYKRQEGDFLLVINAANIDKDVAWMRQNAEGFNITLQDESPLYGQIAVQGKNAERVVEEVLEIPCRELVFYTFKCIDLSTETIIVSRTGYTGEDGFEIYGSHGFIVKAWQKLMLSNRALPCGLGARDTLRFEVGLPLYGDELTSQITPLEAGLGMFVKTAKEEFIGKDAIVRQKQEGVKRRIVGIELSDRAIPRHGYEVTVGGKTVGQVTTGYCSISTKKSVCMAMLLTPYTAVGTPVEVIIHRKPHRGIVTKRRFYDKSYKR